MPTDAPPPILWEPSDAQVASANMTRFMRYAGDRAGRPFRAYDDLWRWSVGDLEAFWGAIWDYFEVGALAACGYERVLGSRATCWPAAIPPLPRCSTTPRPAPPAA
jgi:hypothetical protein